MGKEKIVGQCGSSGLIWISGWLFTVGFLELSFWKGVLAVIIWPYYLGVTVNAFL